MSFQSTRARDKLLRGDWNGPYLNVSIHACTRLDYCRSRSALVFQSTRARVHATEGRADDGQASRFNPRAHATRAVTGAADSERVSIHARTRARDEVRRRCVRGWKFQSTRARDIARAEVHDPLLFQSTRARVHATTTSEDSGMATGFNPRAHACTRRSSANSLLDLILSRT